MFKTKVNVVFRLHEDDGECHINEYVSYIEKTYKAKITMRGIEKMYGIEVAKCQIKAANKNMVDFVKENYTMVIKDDKTNENYLLITGLEIN